jgi:DnaJ-class molecular chaperone
MTYTISGDAERVYVSDATGRIVDECDTLAEAEQALAYYNATQPCSTCGGSGRGSGLDVKKESPVAPGLFIWTPPLCETCGGAGRVARPDV